MKHSISLYFAKIIRRIVLPMITWYRQKLFWGGVKKHGDCVSVLGPVYLWNDNVTIGEKVNVYPNVTLWGPGEITIGSHVEIGIGTTIYSSKSVTIKDYVSIAANCYIIDSNHGIDKNKRIQQQTAVVKGPVLIEEDVWLGAGVTVLSGVHIGKGAVIGAGAVVTKNIPDYAIAIGVPAKVIDYRK